MFRGFSLNLYTNHMNILKNLKTVIYGNVTVLNRNRKIVDVQINRNVTLNKFKLLTELRPFQAHSKEQIYLDRRIHNSTQVWSDFGRKNQKKEEMQNYMFVTILVGVCLGMFLFSCTMRSHEDYVFVDPNKKQ